MRTKDILGVIRKLPIEEQLQIIEKTAKTIKAESEKEQMTMAAEALYEDYKADKELIIFTDLDLEDFYEAR